MSYTTSSGGSPGNYSASSGGGYGSGSYSPSMGGTGKRATLVSGGSPEPDAPINTDRIEIPVKGVLSSDIGNRIDPFTNKVSYHKGVDIAAKEGTVLESPCYGTVKQTGTNSQMGNFIKIEDNEGREHTLMHMASAPITFPGSSVTPSTPIGFLGSTGNSTGPHTHWEVRSSNGSIIDPLSLVGTGQ